VALATAASLCAISTVATSLRDSIVSQLGHNVRRACKAEDASTSDRFCEQESDQGPECSCQEVCHVWGDPYVAPFWSECAVKSMSNAKKTYTLWHLPEKPGRAAIEITNTIFELNRRADYVEAVFINGEMVLHVDNCTDEHGSATNAAEISTFDTHSDRLLASMVHEAQASGAEALPIRDTDVTITVKAICFFKRVWHLKATVTIVDNGVGKYDDMSFHSVNLNTTTPMFADDTGACVSPAEVATQKNLNCGRRSSEKSTEGRTCSCGTGCSVYGDPRVFDFYAKRPEKTRDASGSVKFTPCDSEHNCFKLDKAKKVNKDPSKTVLFSFGDIFGVDIRIDKCEYVREFNVYMFNPQRAKDCEITTYPGIPESVDDMSLSEDDVEAQYGNVAYRAKDLCRGSTAQQRTTVQVPSDLNGRTWNSDFSEGYDLGIYAKLVSGKFMRLNRGGTVKQCAKMNSISESDVVELIDYGTTQVTGKCHKTKFSSRRYFNLCIKRSNVIRTAYEPLFDTVKRVRFRKINKYLHPEQDQSRSMSNATASEEFSSLLLAMEDDPVVGGYCPLGQNSLGNSKYRPDDKIHYMDVQLGRGGTTMSLTNAPTLPPSLDDQALDDRSLEDESD